VSARSDEWRWARRVRQDLIARLYALDAKGIVDDELIDEVGYAFYARCESIQIATRAHYGRATCRRCRAVVEHDWKRDTPMVCACGWSQTWGDYLKSYQRKQLFGGTAYPLFKEFLERWPKARTPRDKLLAIDWLVHACHLPEKSPWARPAATNLIEGTASELTVFLDKLAYGERNTPGMEEARAAWQRLRSERLFPGSDPER